MVYLNSHPDELFRRLRHDVNRPLLQVADPLTRLRDLQAGAAVGAQPVLVLTGKGKKTRKDGDLPEGTVIHADRAEAVRSLLQ